MKPDVQIEDTYIEIEGCLMSINEENIFRYVWPYRGDGAVLFHIAMRQGFLNVIKKLIVEGYIVYPNHFYLAEESGHAEVISYLKEQLEMRGIGLYDKDIRQRLWKQDIV